MADPFAFDSEEEAIVILEQEVKKFMSIAKKVWQMYLDSYSPVEYVRTGNAMDAMELVGLTKIDEDTIGMKVTWRNDLSYHSSYINDNKKPKGHALMLISNGWHVNKGWHKSIYRFGYYEGFDWMGKVQEEYGKVKHEGVTLEFIWSGESDYTR